MEIANLQPNTGFELFLLVCAGLFAPILAVTEFYSLYYKRTARHEKSKYRINNIKLILFYLAITVFAYVFCMNRELRILFGLRLGAGIALYFLFTLLKSLFRKR